MLFYCACAAFLFISSGLLTVIALPVVTQTTTATIRSNETEMKLLRSPDEVNTIRIETLEPRQPTTVSKYSPVTSSMEDDEEEEEDSGMDEMMSLRPCQISDITYQHREQIPRNDPCEICVCVDSEMYCLWKLCPTHHQTTPQPPSSQAANFNKQPTTKQSINDNKTTMVQNNITDFDMKENEIDVTNEKFTKILTDQRKYNALKKLEVTSPNSLIWPVKAATTTTTTSSSSSSSSSSSTTTSSLSMTTTTEKAVTTPSEPTVCYVMGVMYRLGEVLPRDTGTCLECSCSEGARVTCSPKDCVSQPDLDYLSHNNNLDMFDLDTF